MKRVPKMSSERGPHLRCQSLTMRTRAARRKITPRPRIIQRPISLMSIVGLLHVNARFDLRLSFPFDVPLNDGGHAFAALVRRLARRDRARHVPPKPPARESAYSTSPPGRAGWAPGRNSGRATSLWLHSEAA